MEKEDQERILWMQKSGAIDWPEAELLFMFPDNWDSDVMRRVVDIARGVKVDAR